MENGCSNKGVKLNDNESLNNTQYETAMEIGVFDGTAFKGFKKEKMGIDGVKKETDRAKQRLMGYK